MNKEEIKALLAIINRQCFIGVSMEAIQNNLEYRLLRSAATKLERMLLDIESGYNNFRWYIQRTNSELLHTPPHSELLHTPPHVTQYPAACHPETAESGQQTDLPTKCGQQDRKEQA